MSEDALSEWERVYLPIDPGVVLLDIAFVPDDLNHGFLLGTRQTIMETKDGGNTWAPRSIPSAEDEDFNYRFNSISFKGKEGWIVGKPAILLYTSDAGESWERIPLSSQLPGDMVYIKATGDKSAEMVTDEGAIYVTSNRGYNWRAAVQETVSATLNRTVSSGISGASYYTGTFNAVNRSPDGRYVAVSSRGNFYLTWEPGQPFWQPHNRAVARRIQNMGWRADGGLWLLVRGGGLYLSKGSGITEEFEEVPVQSRGFGILDVGFRSEKIPKIWKEKYVEQEYHDFSNRYIRMLDSLGHDTCLHPCLITYTSEVCSTMTCPPRNLLFPRIFTIFRFFSMQKCSSTVYTDLCACLKHMSIIIKI
ncbi:photosystem II stability/assembly factor HCF136, chloroplastic isoform X1 [Juglans microcarpa x Juglans regia]|uniref:photosystem II stability/assembly factor HCF136, chloroplastic isoform X1 n=1 Tax=Juglans microcarpa x Juglans regia TaxID=2249226 RepID=UPI001B7F0339|nr:photosystem II stability/assembly factor HCF136, chloroplastic isoform X1 [Juglans microcarpa x Juglans regia]